ncbi:hypothetical protein [Sphingomonas bacterium]|uniref:hypothetical protein n=1 Tax=Sphingomonas bacterium TaxID=1895847 RepID=UPI0015774E90|nr:hypothetical protein [Sphingomonas bacterium]
MLRATLVLASTLAMLPGAASAKTFKLGADPKVATVTLPDAWDGDEADGQLEALSPDKTIYLSATAVDAADVKAAGQEVSKVLAENKIELKGDSRKVAALTVAGMSGAAISWDAKDADGPTQVHLVTLKTPSGGALVVLRWGDADAEKDHAAEIDAIVKSVAAAK